MFFAMGGAKAAGTADHEFIGPDAAGGQNVEYDRHYREQCRNVKQGIVAGDYGAGASADPDDVTVY